MQLILRSLRSLYQYAYICEWVCEHELSKHDEQERSEHKRRARKLHKLLQQKQTHGQQKPALLWKRKQAGVRNSTASEELSVPTTNCVQEQQEIATTDTGNDGNGGNDGNDGEKQVRQFNDRPTQAQ